MAWCLTRPEQVTTAAEGAAAGRALKVVAAEAGVTASTLARWYVSGAPVDAPDIPRGTPLLVAAHRRKNGVATDAPLGEAETFALARVAAKELARAAAEFLAVTGGGVGL